MSAVRAPHAVLLDTCAVISIDNGDPLQPGAQAAMMEAALTDGIVVSPISALEIGLLSRTIEPRLAAR